MADIDDAFYELTVRERDLARSQVARLTAELTDWQESAKRAASEMCGDEKHCSCVPLLRRELAEANGQVDLYKQRIQQLYASHKRKDEELAASDDRPERGQYP